MSDCSKGVTVQSGSWVSDCKRAEWDALDTLYSYTSTSCTCTHTHTHTQQHMPLSPPHTHACITHTHTHATDILCFFVYALSHVHALLLMFLFSLCVHVCALLSFCLHTINMLINWYWIQGSGVTCLAGWHALQLQRFVAILYVSVSGWLWQLFECWEIDLASQWRANYASSSFCFALSWMDLCVYLY